MNLLFDYDGTLHNCLLIYAPAFRAACAELEREGLLPPLTATDAEIGGWLGLSAPEMWHAFAPDLPEEQQQRASQMVSAGMVAAIRRGEARLYPGAAEVLRELKAAGHNLFFLSNCKRAYLAAHRAAFHLDDHFTACYCAEACGWLTKAEIFPQIAAAYPGDYVMIGDRRHDMAVAAAHNLPAIGCAYGYGTADELSEAAYIAHDVREIPALVAEIARA